ncbi:segment polarity protein dishevelled homolog DVL-3-like, partial [Plectropomus leopardus]|uniref:segment polarity protein dishevelled homolog DVL-3-like n=1 Tax=Plectropomus leopardus TaxID=160734 RepID=UPI001C4CCBD0
SDVVDWLHRNVEGFTDRREARKYAGNLLKAGYIRHTVNKVTFSEQCYYVFGDLCGDLGLLTLDQDEDSSRAGGSDCDPLGPAPGPQWPPAFPYQYPVPHPYSSPHLLHQPLAWGGAGAGPGGAAGGAAGGGAGRGAGRGAGSQLSEGSRSSGSNCSDGLKEAGGASQSESTKQEVSALPNKQPATGSPGDDVTRRPLTSHCDSEAPSPPRGQRRDLSAPRQSFCLAMGNAGDFFVDVM